MAQRGGRRGGAWGERSVRRASSRSVSERGHGLNYARRQQYRRLSRAGRAAAGSVVAALLALVVWGAGAGPRAGMLLLLAVGRGLYARHWLALAGRSRVGARSEDDVQRALAPLRSEGWQLRHSLRWRGRETLTRWRSSRGGLRWRSRRRPERTTIARSLGCASRRRGCRGAGEDGHATAPLASCASSVRGASSASSTTCWWFRSTA